MSSEYGRYYKIIEKAAEKFEYFQNRIENISDFERKHSLYTALIEFAVYHNTGIWCSSSIENFYTDYAETIDIENYNIEYEKNSFLHVITAGYASGGHTRVIERWIDNAPQNEKHSAVFLNPNNDDMSALENYAEEKSGRCIYFEKHLSFKEKALKLRELALHYEYVILHTHSEDALPLASFGTEKFTRPVLFYCHADHLFRLSKSISDLVLTIKENDETARIKCGINNTFFLGIPSKEIVYIKPDKTELRKKTGFPADKKIIISAGSEHKYITEGNGIFPEILKKLVNNNTLCFLAGIPKNNKYWQKIEKQSKGKIKTLGYIGFNSGYPDYISSADLFIDSYPVTGYTAAIDAVSCGTPVLSLKSPDTQLDYLLKTQAFCITPEELIYKAQKILNDKEYAQIIIKEEQKQLEKYQSKTAWNKRTAGMLKACPPKHSVKRLQEGKDYKKIDDLSVLINLITDKNALKRSSMLNCIIKESFEDFEKYGLCYRHRGIPFIFETLSFKKSGRKTKVIKIFNKTAYVF